MTNSLFQHLPMLRQLHAEGQKVCGLCATVRGVRHGQRDLLLPVEESGHKAVNGCGRGKMHTRC